MNRCLYALLYLGLVVVSIISIKSISGVVEVPHVYSGFKNRLAKHDLAVVHFVNYDVLQKEEHQEKAEVAHKKTSKELDDQDIKQTGTEPSEADYMLDMLEDMKEAFKAAADSTRYQRANVGFIGVDLTQIPRLIEEYNLHDFSTLMLFKDGVPFEAKGEIVETNAILTSRSKIKDFIDEHFDDIIGDMLEDLSQEERSYAPVTRVYSYPRYAYRRAYYGYPRGGYWGGGLGWRYPYWRRYGYWGRPFGGFGFGFGGRRGGFGIGFGW